MYGARGQRQGLARTDFAIRLPPSGEVCLACQHTSMVQRPPTPPPPSTPTPTSTLRLCASARRMKIGRAVKQEKGEGTFGEGETVEGRGVDGGRGGGVAVMNDEFSGFSMQLGCRPWNLSLTSVVVLALSNMLLTFLLLQSETCNPDEVPRDLESNVITEWNLGTLIKEQQQQQSDCVTQDYQPLPADANGLKLNIKLGRWDARRLFRTFDHVLVGASFVELSQAYRVCLATQSSVEKLHSVVQAAHHWTGPMSVALYAAGDEEFEVLQKYLVYLRRCYEPIRERVTFSLAVPRIRPPKKQPREFELPEVVDCAKPEGTLNELMNGVSTEQTNWRIRNVYPQNHMRNLARKNCQSDYVFLTDVDIVPSFNLTGALDEFLRTDTCDKCAYVIPTYELDSRVRFPQNKTELVRLARKGLARPFHQKVFIHNQFATNFTRWILDATPNHKNYGNVRSGKVYISHDVTNFEFLYEPFYVAKDIVPAHDERFMGYGYTRNTQVYEMYVAGYQFKVLSPVFTGHWGLQTRKTRPAWRERQNSANRKHFETFKKEVFARYMRDPLKMMKNAN
ncbi:N-acetyllactosaminide beta-1,3-N-acetylglucosaminyltransferase [Habropoda laboriosa]|uniref:Beta-1,4-glucuronyltransferase 1 n=1 Tax=Habropoda laboriosa TaxID=597456 RepID=A0A0L7RF42_9HYME|nr:N-acetyllactosaminide beta-1,3-N-acetylglucosaminyltransferase [Habropoda laboriosa]